MVRITAAARRSRRAALAACAVSALLVAACSASSPSATSPSPTATPSEEADPGLAHAQCMRDNGLPDFPDPVDRWVDLEATGIDPNSAEFKAAEQACRRLLPGGTDAESSPAGAPGWETVVPGGDCQCSDGSEFSFQVRKASTDKVILFLQDGGNCFSAETCAPDRELYNTTITEGPGSAGVFDFTNERNPFADYSVVYVPYCTADVHLGNATTEHGPDLTIQHKGYVNGTAALGYLAATFPDATEVVVMGESAGSVAAPVYGGLVADRLQDAAITVLANGSGSYPSVGEINRRYAEAWGLVDVMAAWPENVGVTAEEWSVARLYIQSWRHDPDLAFARIDFAYDERQAIWYPIVDLPVGDLLGRLAANERLIEDAGVNLFSYTAPGDDHTALTNDRFYTTEVDGQTLVDWVADLVAGEPVEDVQCEECGVPSSSSAGP